MKKSARMCVCEREVVNNKERSTVKKGEREREIKGGEKKCNVEREAQGGLTLWAWSAFLFSSNVCFVRHGRNALDDVRLLRLIHNHKVRCRHERVREE